VLEQEISKMNEELERQTNLSSRRRRLVAFMIDHFVITCLIGSIILLALGTKFYEENNLENMPTTMLAVMIPGFLLFFAKDSIKGISFGK
jgi:low temperature requirement protein LtrA